MSPTSVAAVVAVTALAWPWKAAASPACDRTCLTQAADAVIASMVAHEPARLHLAALYRATENGVAAAPGMMTIWQTATAARDKFYVLDPTSEQVFVIVRVAEGPHDALLFGRLKMHDGVLTQMEIYVDRSRSDAGFQFDAGALAHLPAAWTQRVAASRVPSRESLLQVGRAIFDTAVPSPAASAQCVLMENGKVVAEDPDVLKSISSSAPAAPPRPHNADGTVSIPCGAPPFRPTDPHARTDIVDEEQGIVVSIATVDGIVEPYVITAPTQSAFVPNAMLQPYAVMLGRQVASGKYGAARLEATPAAITVAQLHRVFDGKLQGMMMLQKLGPPGGYSPWVAR